MPNPVKTIGIVAVAQREGGGVFQYTITQVEALSLCYNKLKIVLFTDNNENCYDQIPHIEIRKIKTKKTIVQKLLMFWCLLFHIRKNWVIPKSDRIYFNDIDLFISPSHTPYPHYFLNKNFVFTLHDMQDRYYPENFSFSERYKRLLLQSRLCAVANYILCESEYVKNDICNFWRVSKDKVKVFPAPPSTQYLNFRFEQIIATKIIAKYNLPQRFIYYPAQLWPHKNHVNLLKAMAIILTKDSNMHLVLTGHKDKSITDIRRACEELQLTDHVHFCGYIEQNEIPYFYKLSQMLVMPTLFESISIPVYEAFSLGVPVCCSNAVGLPHQIQNAGFLFNPNNINEIAESILTILNNASTKQQIITNAYKLLTENDMTSYASKLMSILK